MGEDEGGGRREEEGGGLMEDGGPTTKIQDPCFSPAERGAGAKRDTIVSRRARGVRKSRATL